MELDRPTNRPMRCAETVDGQPQSAAQVAGHDRSEPGVAVQRAQHVERVDAPLGRLSATVDVVVFVVGRPGTTRHPQQRLHRLGQHLRPFPK